MAYTDDDVLEIGTARKFVRSTGGKVLIIFLIFAAGFGIYNELASVADIDQPPATPEGYIPTGNAFFSVYDANSSEKLDISDIGIYKVTDESYVESVANDTVFDVAANSTYLINITGYCIDAGYVNCSEEEGGWNNVIYLIPRTDKSDITAEITKINGSSANTDVADFGVETHFTVEVDFAFGYNVSYFEAWNTNAYCPNATIGEIANETQAKYVSVYMFFDANVTVNIEGCSLCGPAQWCLDVEGTVSTFVRIAFIGPNSQFYETDNVVADLVATVNSGTLTDVRVFQGLLDDYDNSDNYFAMP